MLEWVITKIVSSREKCDYSLKLFLFKQHCSTKKHNRKKCSNAQKNM